MFRRVIRPSFTSHLRTCPESIQITYYDDYSDLQLKSILEIWMALWRVLLLWLHLSTLDVSQRELFPTQSSSDVTLPYKNKQKCTYQLQQPLMADIQQETFLHVSHELTGSSILMSEIYFLPVPMILDSSFAFREPLARLCIIIEDRITQATRSVIFHLIVQ